MAGASPGGSVLRKGIDEDEIAGDVAQDRNAVAHVTVIGPMTRENVNRVHDDPLEDQIIVAAEAEARARYRISWHVQEQQVDLL